VSAYKRGYQVIIDRNYTARQKEKIYFAYILFRNCIVLNLNLQ